MPKLRGLPVRHGDTRDFILQYFKVAPGGKVVPDFSRLERDFPSLTVENRIALVSMLDDPSRVLGTVYNRLQGSPLMASVTDIAPVGGTGTLIHTPSPGKRWRILQFDVVDVTSSGATFNPYVWNGTIGSSFGAIAAGTANRSVAVRPGVDFPVDALIGGSAGSLRADYAGATVGDTIRMNLYYIEEDVP